MGYGIEFSDESIRSRFVSKVFGLVTIMFIIVAVTCAMPFIFPTFMDWTQQNKIFMIVACCVYAVMAIVLACCTSVRRSFPLNIIVLGIFTLASGCMTMAVTATYNVQSVLLAFCITTGVSAAIAIFAITTKRDITSCLGIACILGVTLFFFGLVAAIASIFFHVKFLYTVYAALGALLAMLYLAIDIQMVMGGKRYEISPEEYIFAAMQIFLDILNIFMFILQLFKE
ncbi:unnamed protein product [Cylicocyclus nassatus]|uniref:Uncharacterized protein n=1 Tax=Cylicocyclus nassatus TaxID=53992 RepID=A0AA36DQQ3_CYLNA|nr:unnamed protein product [Cylicocyclus nassatus]